VAAMFQVNDVIIYGGQGVCEIVSIEEKTVSGKKKQYFVLKPVDDPGSTIYAPTDQEQVLKKMRRLLSEAEILNLLDSIPDERLDWIHSDNDRKECYKRILASGNHAELIRMLKSLYAHKKEREAAGKRLYAVDENFFKEAEKTLFHEFRYVLKLKDKDELMQYIASRIDQS
jgi:CarD family transcriptional regulator